MGFKLKVEGPSAIELGTTSIISVKFGADIPHDSNARSTDLGSTIEITGKILTALDGAGDSAQTMVYGDPMNYELGLFGEFTVRVDESVKAVERMYTILGDAMVGGNLVVHNGMVVGTLAATG